MSEITCPLAESSQRFPNDVAIAHGGNSVTYLDLNLLTDRIASFLKGEGIKERDHVGLCDEVSIRWVAAFFALIRLGAVACPLSPRLPVDAMSKAIETLSLRFALNIDSSLPPADVSTIIKIKLPPTDQLPAIQSSFSHVLDLDQAATAILTSGSSSLPKAALHSLGNHIFSARGLNQFLSFGSDDRWLLSLPVHHVSGLAILFRTVVAGATLAIPLQNESVVEGIISHNVTHLSLVSIQLRELLKKSEQLKKACHYIKAILLGGSFFSSGLLEEALKAELPVVLSYGLTEMSSTVTARFLTKPITHLCGPPLPYRKIRISESREIEVSGETMFLGYLGETKTELTSDNWFRSGDCGQLDDNGELTVTGRIDNLIVSGGENIQPEEIETALCAIEGIQEAVVVPIDCEKFGQRPVAFIRAENSGDKKEKEYRRFLSGKLESYKIPDFFFELPLPDGRAIKQSRSALAALARRLLFSSES